MRYLLVPVAIAMLAGFTLHHPANAKGKAEHAASAQSSSSSENCGTPEEPKACPPMPRRPLQHYPANKRS